MDKVQLVAELLGYLAMFVTIVARLTPTQKDDSFAGKFLGLMHKVYKVLPSLGVNPSVKLEDK